jgi:Thymidylate synthase complementing protein
MLNDNNSSPRISAKVIEDSIYGKSRLITMELEYWRAIHSEFMTHRVFSRNASSSRAIPVSKLLNLAKNFTAGPAMFMANKAGMQSTENLSAEDQAKAEMIWLEAANNACESAQKLIDLNVHKQFANRLLEPFSTIKVIVTSCNWENFFSLRNHKDAQPEIKLLAQAMQEEQQKSIPNILNTGDWHLPYVSLEERQTENLETLKKLSTARCARVSYLTHDGLSPSVEKDCALHDMLVSSRPIHASPAEHQATPDPVGMGGIYSQLKLHGNLPGWVQYRKTIEATLFN